MNRISGWLRQMGAKCSAGLRSFMTGRYGTDRLNMAILCAGLVASILSMLISVLALTQIKLFLPLAITLAYAFLTIRMDDQSVLDFIIRAVKYFLTTEQYYEWKEESVGTHRPIGGDVR